MDQESQHKPYKEVDKEAYAVHVGGLKGGQESYRVWADNEGPSTSAMFDEIFTIADASSVAQAVWHGGRGVH